MTARVAALALAAALAGGCSDRSDRVPSGQWGGHNAELVVSSVGAVARFKCNATGAIAQRLRLEDGAFDVPGSFLTPATNAGLQSARYAGSVSGDIMTLTVSIAGQAAGTFELRRGAAPTFDVCNFQ
jgi:hypothetical protein